MGSPPWRGIPFPGAFIKEAHSTTGAGTATEIDVRVNAKVWKSGKVILAVELDGFHSAVFVKLFALAKLAARNIGWIAGFNDSRIEDLRLKYVKSITANIIQAKLS